MFFSAQDSHHALLIVVNHLLGDATRFALSQPIISKFVISIKQCCSMTTPQAATVREVQQVLIQWWSITLMYVHHSRELATAANHKASVWLGCRT